MPCSGNRIKDLFDLELDTISTQQGSFPVLMPCFLMTGVKHSMDDIRDAHDMQLYHPLALMQTSSSSLVTTWDKVSLPGDGGRGVGCGLWCIVLPEL